MAAHGSKEMPVWGPVFLNMAQHGPAVMQLRIRNLTRYVESMQQQMARGRTAQEPDSRRARRHRIHYNLLVLSGSRSKVFATTLHQ